MVRSQAVPALMRVPLAQAPACCPAHWGSPGSPSSGRPNPDCRPQRPLGLKRPVLGFPAQGPAAPQAHVGMRRATESPLESRTVTEKGRSQRARLSGISHHSTTLADRRGRQRSDVPAKRRRSRAASSQAALATRFPHSPCTSPFPRGLPRHPGVTRPPRKILRSTAGPLLGTGCCPPTPHAPHLCTQWAVAFEKVGADLCLPGHVDVAIGTAAVAANPL